MKIAKINVFQKAGNKDGGVDSGHRVQKYLLCPVLRLS
jgi:hypothetical protein